MTAYTNFLKLRAQAYDQQNWDVLMNENLAIIDFNAGALNSKNRVALGGVVSAGTGLNADYTAMVVEVGGITYNIAAGSIACTASALNYLYVNASGTVMATTAAPTGDYVSLAVVDTSATVLLRVGDLRQLAPDPPDQLDLVEGAGIAIDKTDPLAPVIAIKGTSHVRVDQSGVISFPAAVYTKMVYDGESFDTLGEFDLSLSRFTALYDGYYDVSAIITTNASTTAGELHVLRAYVNGASTATLNYKRAGSAGTQSVQGSTSLFLTAGDYLEFYLYTSVARSIAAGAVNNHATISRRL